MAKFYGPVGFAVSEETRPGIWVETVTERNLSGDVLANIRKSENDQTINQSVVLNNKLSVLADPFARDHFFAIRYVKWMGGIWEVTNVEVLYPRLILTIGGVYHGQTA